LRVKILDASGVTYTSDFRACLSYNGVYICSSWASAGLSESRSAITSGNAGGDIQGTMTIVIETRSLASAGLPAGTTFGNVQIGVALAYQKDYNACQSSSGMAFASQGGAWSNWAYGASGDNDPGCFQVGMKIGVINTPPNTQYISTTIPTSLVSNTTYNNKYNVIIKNTGMPWTVLNQVGSIVRNVDGHCDSVNFAYDAGGTLTCTDYIIYSSQRFRLERTDTTPIVVRSKELRPNSNDVTYSGGVYTFNQPDTFITAQGSRGSVNTSNTIPLLIKQEITYRRATGSYEICVPGDPAPNPDPGGGISPILNYIFKPIIGNFAWIFNNINIFNTARAYVDGSGENCSTYTFDYISETPDTWAIDVSTNDNATFTPINITTPSLGGAHTLRFKLVDLQNLNNSSNGYSNGGQFGSEATMNLSVVGPSGTLTASNCSVANGASSCSSTVTWTTANLTGGATEVTRNNPANTIISPPNNSPTQVSITPGSTTFYLYHNIGGVPTILAQATAVASTGMSADMSASVASSPCTIAIGASTCTSTLSWNIVNPEGAPTAITASGMTNINVTNTLVTPQSGTQVVTVTYPSRTFYLYNNSKSLVPNYQYPNGSGLTVNAICALGSTWSGSSCVATGAPVAGGWGWGSWSACVNGTQTRNADCNNPYPANGGSNCLAPTPNPQTQACSVNGIGGSAVNGVCSVTHYNCTSGTSANPISYPSRYTWYCNGVNGGSISPQCVEKRSPGYIEN
jgi:hypothetical protein